VIAEVLVDIPHKALDKVFDYVVPKDLEDSVSRGQRVDVPFGARIITGFVVGLKDATQVKGLKSIKTIRDLVPYFDEERLRISSYLAEKHLYPRAAYLEAMLPRGLSMKYERRLRVVDMNRLPKPLRPYFRETSDIAYDEALKKTAHLVREALETGALEQYPVISQQESVKEVDVVRLKKTAKVRGDKQKAVLEYLRNRGKPIDRKRLQKATEANSDSLRRLEKHGLIDIVSEERYRELQSLYNLKDKAVTLSEPQRDVYQAIKDSFGSHKTFLLHGVTSSGKTEIYIKLAEQALVKGQSALILLPEISLTPKIAARFKSRFKNQVALYHSALSTGEQYDEWRKVLRKEARLVIGARSAVFAPLENIGLIVMDEEQSDSFIQSDAPQYDAKEVARMRAKTHAAPLLLGSATPSVSSYYYAQTGRYELLELKERALKSLPPELRVVDMKSEFKKGNTTMFAEALQKAIEKRLFKGEQTLLLINRRGHAQFVLCRDCGHVVKCDDCTISMTYHKTNDVLMCHHCNKKQPMVKTCPKCGSFHIRYMGIGSERVEAALKNLFPEASILRMDRDTTGKKQGHEHLLYAFEEEGDILVGTQMIAKGLDFEDVTLVGVLSADMGLHVPDFYAESETFSLLMQIAGRSGRREKKGEVIVQTYDKDHPVFSDLQTGDYESFYRRDIAYRIQARVEPILSLTQLLVAHKQSRLAYHRALEVLRRLKQDGFETLGPSLPKIPYKNGMYRQQLIVRHNQAKSLSKTLGDLMDTVDMKRERLIVNHYPRDF